MGYIVVVLILFLFPIPSIGSVSLDVHEKCKDAKDYLACLKLNSDGVPPYQEAEPTFREVESKCIADGKSSYLDEEAAFLDYLPIIKVPPKYPRKALSRGIRGSCVIEYTVTKTGSIRDPKAVECVPEGMFEKASIKATLKFKYEPRLVDGEPVEVPCVRNTFTYDISDY